MSTTLSSLPASRRAALDGSIEDLLAWHPAKPGDFFYIPANTVHAIGAGITVIEVQQNSDITYRLYDYGRPRELHVEEGMSVAYGAPYPAGLHRRLAPAGAATLVEGPYFRLDRLDGGPEAATLARYQGAVLLMEDITPIGRVYRNHVQQIVGKGVKSGCCGED